MKQFSRLDFLRFTAGLSVIPAAANAAACTSAATVPSAGKDVGIYTGLDPKGVDFTFKRIHDLGFNSCELYTGEFGPNAATALIEGMKKYNMKVHALFTLGPGPTTWNFYEGQSDIGLVSPEYREGRIQALMQLSDLAKACGIGMIETHVGYIPENPMLPNYNETVEALKKIVGYCKKNNQVFLYHAGQETPTTLLRTMTDVGFDNQGVGMDTANLIMYDRGHPIHSLDVYGKYVKLVNAKDGIYPTGPRELGKEVMIGQGKVDFPLLLTSLKKIGYDGPLIIEREAAEGREWDKDVKDAKKFLEGIWNSAS